MRKVLIFSFIAALFVAVSAQAQYGLYPKTILLIDSCTTCAPIAADCTSAEVLTAYADYAYVTVELDSLGGTGTYGIDILTSIDGVSYDTLRFDTLVANQQVVGVTLTHGGAGSDYGVRRPLSAVAGSAIRPPLAYWLKVRIDEISASSGSDFRATVFLNNARQK